MIQFVNVTSNYLICTMIQFANDRCWVPLLISKLSNDTSNMLIVREFTKGCLVKGGLAIRHIFDLHINNGT